MGDAPTTGAKFEVAVICVTHNSAALMNDFIAGLREGLGHLRSVVVFVDSGSDDANLDSLSKLMPGAHVLYMEGNRGFSAGINTGVRRVNELGGAEAYAVVNPDVVLLPDSLPRLVAAVRAPGVGVVAPRLHDEHQALLPSLRRRPRVLATWCEAIVGGRVAARLGLPTEVIRDPHLYESDRAVGWATGGMLVISRECASTVGNWDESFFLYEEEVNFALRAADAGFVLRYVADARAQRTIGPGPVAPWAEALMRANRVTLVSRRSGRFVGLVTRLGLLMGASARALMGRSAERAAVWALLHSASPAVIMARYRPGAHVVAAPHSGAPRPRARAARSTQ
jgi:N-acetylglucosaminyl-diphospho-decaprenol L-rhamnosyltransferase